MLQLFKLLSETAVVFYNFFLFLCTSVIIIVIGILYYYGKNIFDNWLSFLETDQGGIDEPITYIERMSVEYKISLIEFTYCWMSRCYKLSLFYLQIRLKSISIIKLLIMNNATAITYQSKYLVSRKMYVCQSVNSTGSTNLATFIYKQMSIMR